MTKQALIIALFLGIFPALGGASSCPTCAKSPVNSSLMEALVAKNKGKRHPFYNLLSQGELKEKNPAKTPVEMMKAQMQRYFKDEAPETNKTQHKRIPPVIDPRNDNVYKIMEKRQLREQLRQKK